MLVFTGTLRRGMARATDECWSLAVKNARIYRQFRHVVYDVDISND